MGLKYLISYEEFDKGEGAAELLQRILDDAEFPGQTELVIGNWGDTFEKEGSQTLIDGIIENKDYFSNVEKLFIGDMDYEECEVSWIVQGDYSKLWEAMPQLKELTIKGSEGLELGEICHQSLESLTIICGGLHKSVIKSIQEAKLPNLKKLMLYIGIANYGFNGNSNTIKNLLSKSDFPMLTYLGIVDSEIQDEITKVVLESKYIGQIHTLDLSMGSLTDEGGEMLLKKIPSLPNIKRLDLHYHYLSEKMEKRLKALPIEVDVSERNKPWSYKDRLYYSAMLTE